jgi:hypothetical protein
VDDSAGGYAQIATFQSSDRSFLQYRAFSFLHCRVLSGLQCDIERLEEELDELDSHDMRDVDGKTLRKLESKARDDVQGPEDIAAGLYPDHLKRSRSQVVSELRLKLSEYGKTSLVHEKDFPNSDQAQMSSCLEQETWHPSSGPQSAITRA